MNSSAMPVSSATTLDRTPSAGEKRRRWRMSDKTLVEVVLIVLTSGLIGILYYSFSHALYHYRVG